MKLPGGLVRLARFALGCRRLLFHAHVPPARAARRDQRRPREWWCRKASGCVRSSLLLIAPNPQPPLPGINAYDTYVATPAAASIMVHPPHWNAAHTCTDRKPCVRGRHRDQHIPKHRAWPRQGIFARVGAIRRKEYHVLWAIGAPADRLTKSRAPALQDTSVPRARRPPQGCHVLQGFRVLGRRATASATAPLRPGSFAPPVTQTTNQMPAPKAVTATAALPSQSTARHLRVISALSGLRCPLEKSARPVFSAPVERRTRPSAWLLQDPSALQAAPMVEGRWYALPALFTFDSKSFSCP